MEAFLLNDNKHPLNLNLFRVFGIEFQAEYLKLL